MKIKKSHTPKQIIEFVKDTKDIIFYTGFWFWMKKELEIGRWRRDDIICMYKVTDHKTGNVTYSTDILMAVYELLEYSNWKEFEKEIL